MRPHPSLVESSWLSIFYLHLWILLEKLLQFIVQMCIQLPVFQKKNLTCYTKPYIFISVSVKVLHVSVHTRFGTFHQCADQKFSRLLWFSFLTAAKIFLYCTTVHPALCPNIIAIKNVPYKVWHFSSVCRPKVQSITLIFVPDSCKNIFVLHNCASSTLP